MKIIYLESGRLPTEKAHGYQIMKMCEAMALVGHEVLLLTSRKKNPIREDPFVYYGIKKNFAIKRLPSLNVVNVLPKYGTWVSRVSFALAAKIYLAFHKYDRLYLREHMSGLFFTGFIMETHTLPARIRPSDLRIWRRARRIAVTTHFIKDRLAEAGVDPVKIIAAPDAVDLENFAPALDKQQARDQLGLPQDAVLLGYTGSLKTLGMEKGIAAVIASLKILAPEFERLEFVAVGGSPAHIDEYQKLAAREHVADRVTFIGRVPIPILAVYQKAFDVLLIPFPNQEHYAYFASPLKLFEYMAARRPIVATNLPSLREVLNEQNAVLTAPDNPSALAAGIQKVLNNPDLARKISDEAYEDVQLYTWQNRAKMIVQ